ncbi:UDP-glucuronic acid decarboxylase family protein [Allokutzneria oryzae]|uniref:UDP-glucuronic acid decarboxylase family protein n=1 Tax=Allokutzneria oryzae TaxID=1378989 RepID=A0ABV6A7C2_9PSEU
MRGTCAVVTGGAGFVGSHLCRRLLAEGYKVICVDNLLTGSRRNITGLGSAGHFRFIPWDVSERVRIDEAVDVVFHLASPASPAAYLRYPLETLTVGSAGTHNTLDLAHEKGARYVLASTSEVYGSPHVHPQTETYWGNVNPIGPRSVYDEAKRFAEALVTAHGTTRGTSTAIARIFNTYGPRMQPTDGRAVPTFVVQALTGQALTITGTGTQTRSLCYVDDLVDGLLRLHSSTTPGPVNLGNPDEITMLDLALLIREAAGSDSPITFTGRPQDDPDLRCPDIRRARAELGWSPTVDLREGMARTISWFRSVHHDASTRPTVGSDTAH